MSTYDFEPDPEDYYERPTSRPKEVACRTCGRADLYWHPVHNRKQDYQLTNPDGSPHTCNVTDDFDDLTKD